MKWIYDLAYDKLREEITAIGMNRFVIDQVFKWLYEKNLQTIKAWSNISKINQKALSKRYNTTLIKTIDIKRDQQGTKKFLFELKDKKKVESVLIKEKDHYTFCISTQVGCALDCQFCATGKQGFRRNLTPGEMLSQVLSLKKELHRYTGKLNIVFMGMGEPLLNYENLKQALNIITAKKGIGISPRNITLSTAGVLEKLQQLEADFPKIKVSFSLNASNASQREALMPISKKEKLETIMNYFRATEGTRKHRITFEYVLLKGVNDSPDDADKIVKLLQGISCKINLIPYNPNKYSDFKTPNPNTVEAFSDYLHSKGYTITVRWSKGRDIKSACGQLAVEGP